jgi:Zn-dependent protease with chaperone function
MPIEKWADLAAQSIAHAGVAAIASQALLRAWGVRRPDEWLALRLVALGQPLAVTPLLFFLFPGRAAEAFQDERALLVARRFEEVRVLGADAFHAGLALLAAIGAGLLLMDLVPLLRALWRPSAPPAPAPEALVRAFDAAVAPLGRRAPRLRFLELSSPAVFCAGVRRTEVVVSRGALELLDGEELAAALAHEVAHLARRDPALSWGLMAARALLFFNPVAQLLARVIARDAERRADAAVGGRSRIALASALLKLHRVAEQGALPRPRSARVGETVARRNLPLAGVLAAPLRRGRAHDLEGRCRALLSAPASALPWGKLRLVLGAASLAALAVFVA